MANYVYNRVICTKEIFEKYFFAPDAFGTDKPYITFRKLFGLGTFDDFDLNYPTSIYYGYGHYCEAIDDKRIEIKFCTRWQYPIEVIIKALNLGKSNIECFCCEENHVYVSKFQWIAGGIEELVLLLNDDYWNWENKNEEWLEKTLGDMDCDDTIWYYLQLHKHSWKKWPSYDDYSRYVRKPAVHIDMFDWAQLEGVLEA